MHVFAILIAALSTVVAVLAFIDACLFFLRLHGPFTATGEALLFALSFGRRKPRFFGRLRANPVGLTRSEFVSLLKSAALGVFFWLAIAIVALYIHGPLKPIHEW